MGTLASRLTGAEDGADAPWKTQNVFHFRTAPAAGCSHGRIMAAQLVAASMVGGTVRRVHQAVIQRESPGSWPTRFGSARC